MSKGQILVVEDEFITASDIKRSLVKMGFDVPATVDNGPGAIEKAGEHKPDLVLMDINLIGPMNGIEAAREIRERYGIPVIYLTAQSDDATVEKAVSSDPFGYIIESAATKIGYGSQFQRSIHLLPMRPIRPY